MLHVHVHLYCKLKSDKAVVLVPHRATRNWSEHSDHFIYNYCLICLIFILLSFTCRLSPAPEKSSKFQWTFKLVHLQPEKRTYYFAAYSEKEMTVSNTLYCRF